MNRIVYGYRYEESERRLSIWRVLKRQRLLQSLNRSPVECLNCCPNHLPDFRLSSVVFLLFLLPLRTTSRPLPVPIPVELIMKILRSSSAAELVSCSTLHNDGNYSLVFPTIYMKFSPENECLFCWALLPSLSSLAPPSMDILCHLAPPFGIVPSRFRLRARIAHTPS